LQFDNDSYVNITVETVHVICVQCDENRPALVTHKVAHRTCKVSQISWP